MPSVRYNAVAYGNRWGYLRLGIQGSLQLLQDPSK